MKTPEEVNAELAHNVKTFPGRKSGNGADPDEQEKRRAEDARAFGKFFQFPWEFAEPKSPRLIKGLVGYGDEFMIYGPPEAGKSFFMIDLACCWATGSNWRCRQMTKGLVIYLAGERSESIKRRIRAWALRHGTPLSAIPIAVLGTSVNLMGSSDELQDLGRAMDAARRLSGDMDVVNITGDTVHSLSPGSKEDNHSWGIVLDQCRRLRDTIRQSDMPCFGLVHHTGKDEDRGPRGGNGITGAVNLSASISVRLRKYRLVEIDKGSDLPDDKPHIEPFIIESVTLHHEPDGTPVQAGVHVAIPIIDIPDPPEEELKRIASAMKRGGHTQREIAKAVNKSVGTVNGWLSEKPAGKRSARSVD